MPYKIGVLEMQISQSSSLRMRSPILARNLSPRGRTAATAGGTQDRSFTQRQAGLLGVADSAERQFGRVRTVDFSGGRAEGRMMEQERPRVVLRGPGDGDSMVLTMGPHRAHITRKAARTETGGHWAVGEAWQDPGFDNPPHTHDEAEAFYVLEGSYTFYTDADPVEEVGPGTFVFIPPGAVHGFRTGPQGGKLICFWPSTVEAAFFNDRTDGGSR